MARTKLQFFELISPALLVVCLLPSLAASQSIQIDSTPGHAAKTFVPTTALGAGIDRISTASTDKLFTEPVMKQVLSAGWQTVSYRQNTELYVEAWHWNPQGTWSDPGGKGLFHRQRHARGADPPLLRLSPAASRIHAQRRRRQRLFPPHRRRSEHLLEEQSLSDQTLHRRRRLGLSAMGDHGSGQQSRRQCHSHCLGRALRAPLPGAVLDRRRSDQTGHQGHLGRVPGRRRRPTARRNAWSSSSPPLPCQCVSCASG